MREATREQEEQSVAENMEDIVEVYAERLSAVTHAFALCCHTLQRATRRSESHTTCMILGRIMCEFECVVSVCECSPVHTLSSSGLLPRFSDFIDKYETVLKILLARSVNLKQVQPTYKCTNTHTHTRDT